MYQFKNLSRNTIAATIAVGIYMVADFLFSAAGFVVEPAGPDEFGVVDLLGLIQFLTVLICIGVVGRWIYRASVNAHTISGAMAISPGWAVGWYFVPFANLVMPFRAMKEVWLVSHRSGAQYDERTPALLGWWWGLWLANNVISNLYFQLGAREAVDPQTLAAINLLATATNVPLCIVLVTVMRDISNAQKSSVCKEISA